MPGRPQTIKIGDKFTRLTVVSFGGYDKHRNRVWVCECSCGKYLTVTTGNLRSRGTRSCGCLNAEQIPTNKSHGQSRSVEYKTLQSIKERCFNPTHRAYARYGGRGIRVCKGFLLFEVFRRIVGLRPSESHSIDRVDNDGHYSCGECVECRANKWTMNLRWATKKEQARNQSANTILTLNGEQACLPEWAERTGITAVTLQSRYKRGWTDERILTTPVRVYNH